MKQNIKVPFFSVTKLCFVYFNLKFSIFYIIKMHLYLLKILQFNGFNFLFRYNLNSILNNMNL